MSRERDRCRNLGDIDELQLTLLLACGPKKDEMWEQRYSGSGYVYGTEPNDFLADMAPVHLRPGTVLCLADGEGRNGVYLATQGYEVSSVDLSPSGVEKARALARSKGVSVDAKRGDLTTFDLGIGCWDTIVSIFVHLPPALRADVHRRVVQALKPGGTLILEAYAPGQLGRGTGGPPKLEMLMDLAAIQTELEGLDFLVACETTRAVVEGEFHTGVAAVTQVVGRKR